MSSCFSTGGGGRAYRLETLDLDIIKSPSSTSWLSNSSSPSSTLSESSNCPLVAISTRKPRTPRKRPNQTYNEAAAILSTAYPKIFPTKHLTKPFKYTKPPHEPSDLLMPFQPIAASSFLLGQQLPIEPKMFSLFDKACQSPGEITSSQGNSEIFDDQDLDAESILDEEVGEGLDTIMGNLGVENENEAIDDMDMNASNNTMQMNGFCYGYPVGLGYGMRREMRAMRHVDEGDWWRFPSVNVVDITPKINAKASSADKKKKKKKKKKVEIKSSELVPISAIEKSIKENSTAGVKPAAGPPLLKLNYDHVLNAWSDKGSPFSGDSPAAESAGNDVQARLAQIDLFLENGGIREASVLRYKEKRRTRLFSKKIRYQVRKVNADRRPRMKGRFVRTPNSPED